jgi:hypothetical protein
MRFFAVEDVGLSMTSGRAAVNANRLREAAATPDPVVPTQNQAAQTLLNCRQLF